MPTSSLSHFLRRRAGLCALLLAPAALLPLQGCTDLTETPLDALSPTNTFRTSGEIQAGLTAVYAQLRGMNWAFYNLAEVTTDEQIVPTRGSDWFDAGRWLEIHRQTWTDNSGSALDDMNGMWNDLFTGVSRANLVLNAIEQNGVAGQEQAVAELRVLRAWFYYALMDNFGGVPIVTSTTIEARPRNTRTEVFNFIEQELTEAKAALPAQKYAVGDGNYGRVTQAAADAILASLYLNAEVYTGEVTEAGLTRGQPRWQQAIEAANRVINSNQYRLAGTPAEWKTNFSIDNESSPENIFVVRHVAQPGLGLQLPMRALHYNQLNPAPWNGFAGTAEAYNKFDAADARRSVFLQGPQVSYVDGQPVNDRTGQRLVYTVSIANPAGATEGEGVRLIKFPPLVGAADGHHPNDYPFFRLAEMHMIRAEANYKLGNTGAALADLNLLRGPRAGTLPPLTTVNDDVILNERLFEFAGEGKRRRDLIRFGRFTAPRQYKPQATEPYRILFPIPVTQLATNPQLQQNPGY